MGKKPFDHIVMIRFGLEPFRDGNRLEWLRPNAGQAVSSNSGFSRCDLALEELVAEPYCAFLLRLDILLRRPDFNPVFA